MTTLAPLSTAGPLGPFHATALVQKLGELPTRFYLEYDFLGVGGPDDPDCQDFDGESALFVISGWADSPPVAFKSVAQRIQLTEEGVSVAPSEVEEVCDAAGQTTTSDPQQVGFGPLALRASDIWFPVADFSEQLQALSATIVSCRVAQTGTSPQFVNEVNRGAGELEQVSPAESLAGSSLDGTCVDHTYILDQGTWSSGDVNRVGGLDEEAPYSCDEAATPGCGDMAPGLWATCVTALILDPLAGIQNTESDYTWWWVEDANLALAAQWSNPMNWDGEDARGALPILGGGTTDFTSQQECDTLGNFAV